jgi:hypothetical protein
MTSNGYLDINSIPDLYDVLMTLPEKGKLLEIGTGAGDSAWFFAMTKPEWSIYTVDCYKVAADYQGGYDLDHLSKMVSSWKNIYPNIIFIVHNSFTLPWDIPIDILYLDGDHKYEAVKADFNRFSPYVKEYVFFDDYGNGDSEEIGVQRFVDELNKNEWEVKLSGRMAIAKRCIPLKI